MSLPTPNTRKEQYLNAIATGNAGGLPTPITREEEYLDAIAKSGGGSGDGDMKKSVYDSDLDVAGAGGIKAFVNSAVAGKVDKVEGKGLSANDYTNEDKAIVGGVTSALTGKVDKVEGKGLSTNDYTDEDKAIVDSVTSALATKQDVLTFDDEPTANSNNPVKSGGIFDVVNTSPKTVTGNPVTFSDGIDLPARNVTVTIEPSQSGTGDPSPTNVRPLIGYSEVDVNVTGKNILGGSVLLKNAQAYMPTGVTNTTRKTFYFVANTATVAGLSFSSGIKFKENTAYTIILTIAKSDSLYYTNVRVRYTDGTTFDLMLDSPVTADTKYTKAFVTSENKTIKEIYKVNASGATYLYYDECGVFEGNVSVDNFEPFGKTTTVQLGRTVYGGVLDVTNGKLTLTHKLKDLGELDYTYVSDMQMFYASISDAKMAPSVYVPANAICSNYKCTSYNGKVDKSFNMVNWRTIGINIMDSSYTDAATFKTALSGVMLAYELATPEVIDLTPTEIDMLLGYNTVFTNGTTLSLVYQPNNVLGVAEKYTDDKVAEVFSEIACKETTAGEYTLKATVDENGKVTYEWVAVTP